MADVVRIRQGAVNAMLAETRRQPSLECCGLLAGREGVISLALPAQNALASGTAYEIAPRELFGLFRRMRVEGLEHFGIYHSHPRGENTPSPRDIAAAFYPEAAYFILSPHPDARQPVRAFRIRGERASELAIEVV